MRELVTIGVYDWTLETFLAAVRQANVKRLLDLRQRRGVRGSQYSWANSKRLQAALAEAGVAYEHLPELAPTTELRHLQYAEDAREGVGKRSRERLAADYVTRFTSERLDQVDLAPIVESMPEGATTALLCVERDPEACHRSLVAERISSQFRLPLRHLLPPS
ncbi:MAG: hypothetical protein QOC55_1258 [Thermoleophilaceae bacterium]|nr:hypothetical protein [Thermoleophilaceae bacterium]